MARVNRNCFACRVMRSFALVGAGAGALGFGALLLGEPRESAMLWALAGGLGTAFLKLEWTTGKTGRGVET